jgi:hypothetical protein
MRKVVSFEGKKCSRFGVEKKKNKSKMIVLFRCVLRIAESSS